LPDTHVRESFQSGGVAVLDTFTLDMGVKFGATSNAAPRTSN
jgi:hypothetical protein